MFKCKNKKNTGALQEEYQVEQYRLGESPIEYDVRLFDGNWRDYLPKDEWQKKNGTETMSCVTFSALNSIEIQLNWMLRHNKISAKSKKFLLDNGYMEDGMVNLSDKFTAIKSNTMQNGNYMTAVANSLRKDGAIPESMLEFGTPSSWDEYHDKNQIKPEMEEKGLKFLDYFSIQYEWVVNPNNGGLKEEGRANCLKHLRHAPLQIAKSGHATDYFMGVDKVRFGQYDSYNPFIKERPWEYDPYAVMKIILIDKHMITAKQITAAKLEVRNIMNGRKAPYF